MKCPLCQRKLTLTGSYDLTLLLICERKLKSRGRDCSYAVDSWTIPDFDKALDEFIEQFEVEVNNDDS